MSNYARIVIEVKKEQTERFEKYLSTHPLADCLYEKKTTDVSRIYDFNCNHYDRITPSIEKWLNANLEPEDFAVVGIDEYGHWENGGMDCPHIYLDIVIDA